MRSYPLPQPLFRTVTIRVPAAPHEAAWIQGRIMKFLGWIATILVVCLLLWVFVTSDVLLLRVSMGLLLLGCGVIAGLRIGTQNATAYITDLQRVNKVLCGQQRELEEVNAILLKQVSTDTESVNPKESVSPGEHVH